MTPRTVLYLHSSAGCYGADRQLAAIATGLDPERYRALVVLPENGPLGRTLRAGGVEVLVRPLAVLRRALMSPRGVGQVAGAFAADAGGLGRLARARGVALVHTNASSNRRLCSTGEQERRLDAAGRRRRGSPRCRTSGTSARSTPASSAGGRATAACCSPPTRCRA